MKVRSFEERTQHFRVRMEITEAQGLSADCWHHIHVLETELNLYSTSIRMTCLGVTCSPRDTRFVGSNPSEVDGFLQDVKILSRSPPERRFWVWDFRLVKEPQAWKICLWAKFNRHIHVLVIPKFGNLKKRPQCIGQQLPPHQNKYKCKKKY